MATITPALERVGGFAAFVGEEFDEALAYAALRKAESIDRPAGSPEWLADMETRTGLRLAPGKREPKPWGSRCGYGDRYGLPPNSGNRNSEFGS